MKKHRIINFIILAVLLIVLSACGKSEIAITEEKDIGSEEDFGLKEFSLEDETYLIEKWVRFPELDSDTRIGYGLCILQKSDQVPANIAGNEYSVPLNVVGKLEESEVHMKAEYIDGVDDNPDYALRNTFTFSLPKGSELPKIGTFVHEGKGEQIIDLRDLEVPAEDSAEISATDALVPENSESFDASLAAQEFLDALENCPPVEEEENKLGIGVDRIEKAGDDYYIYWTANEELVSKNSPNMAFVFFNLSFYDPEDYSRSYRDFEEKDGQMTKTFKEGEFIGYDYVRVNFKTDSKVVYMYFKGVEEPEYVYTVPLFYTLILDDNPRVFEGVPRVANGIFD